MKRIVKLFGLIFLLVFFVAACGAEEEAPTIVEEEPVSIEEALIGHWELTNAEVNGRPLEEMVFDLNVQFGEESVNVNEEDIETEADYYFNDGELTIVLENGDQLETTYEIVNTDEENNSLTIEYVLETEPVDLDVSELIVFDNETRTSLSSTANVREFRFNTVYLEDDAGAGLGKIGSSVVQRVAGELLRDMEYKYSLEYVDDAAAPGANNQ